MKNTKHILKKLLPTMLIAALALLLVSCGNLQPTEGEKTFVFECYLLDGTQSGRGTFTSDAATVGEALLAEGLIEGEDGPYGLYVKTVLGARADYDVDGTYWAFYIGDEYAITGVDTTPIEDGQIYSFRMQK